MLCLLIMVGSVVFAQNSQTKPEIIKEQLYIGKALYGFMNGGSDLYYEYGFEQLTAQEINYMEEEFVVERYKMEDPTGALGIYSVHVFRCLRVDTLNDFNCQSQYQLQAVNGDEYISIVYQSGSEAGKQEADKLMNIYISTSEISTEKATIPQELSFLPKPYSGTLKLLKGPLAINNTYSDFLPWLDGLNGYSVWLAELEGVALFVLKDKADLNSFKKRVPDSSIFKEGDDWALIGL